MPEQGAGGPRLEWGGREGPRETWGANGGGGDDTVPAIVKTHRN